MAGLVIDATFSKEGGSFTDDLDELLAAHGMERFVEHHAGACDPCRANEDPDDVPCTACTGNIAGRHPDSERAAAVGNLCQCTVGIREIGSGVSGDA